MTADLTQVRRVESLPRLPLEASLDLTYRCNNRCRHCWLWEADAPDVVTRELTLAEIRDIVDQARALGCRRWSISGGEPMLRPDFPEIFDCVTSKAVGYTLNTNGTLITPEIAQLLRRKGSKLVALYGATAEVNDHITRSPGSFEATMEGFARLKEAGAGFTVQLIPMRDNWHQWDEMQDLAKSLSPHWRVGAPWLFMTACGSEVRNAEIARQRLDPADVVALDPPDGSDDETTDLAQAVAGVDASGGEAAVVKSAACGGAPADDRLFAACIGARRDFHVDPYGGMTFCSFVKDPELRYDLRAGTVREAWEEFIPSFADTVRGGKVYLEGCAACDLRGDCRWCGVYGALEHGRQGARVDHLCDVARASRVYAADWAANHTRYFEIAGVTVKVESDLPVTSSTFERKFEQFRVDGPGDDTISIRHHFGLPELDRDDLGEQVYRKPPWAIYCKGRSWVYLGIAPEADDPSIHGVAVFNEDHARGRIFSDDVREALWRKGGIASLTMFPTDQILLGRVLADREACYLHSGAVVLDGTGLMFVGHSTAGKSTTISLLRQELGDEVEILCDDRNIVRRWPDGYRVHGTWSHGTVPQVSASSAPLGAIVFLTKAEENRIVRIDDRRQIVATLLATLIKPLVDAAWWHKSIDLIEAMSAEVPFYEMRFDKSGAIVGAVRELARELAVGRVTV